ncbi:hypothetical protein JYT22_00120 [Endomicrobium sp. AH-315-J14]|nr:hypothetical protein [Endomicrobium sp. AH-315-J14]
MPPLPDPMTFAVGSDGPFNVGYRTLSTSYDSPDGKGSRKIALNLWYPSEGKSDRHPTYALIFGDPDVDTDAPLARVAYDDGFPVLVHSHGFRGYGGNSAELMRHFATHGWLVVAPDHKDNTLVGSTEPLPTAHYFHRPLDIRASLDALESLPADDPLSGKADLSRVIMSGHSFGTYTTWASAGSKYDEDSIQQACDSGDFPEGGCTAEEIAVFKTDLTEPRVKAGIPMAGGGRSKFFGDSGYNAVKIPMLLMTGGDDDVGAQDLFDLASGIDLTWIDVAGGCHQLYGFGDCENISNDEGFPIVNAYALAFARKHILADDDATVNAIVDGSEVVSDKVSFVMK